jgi:hypothetical protein
MLDLVKRENLRKEIEEGLKEFALEVPLLINESRYRELDLSKKEDS